MVGSVEDYHQWAQLGMEMIEKSNLFLPRSIVKTAMVVNLSLYNEKPISGEVYAVWVMARGT